MDFSAWPLWQNILVFALAGVVILLVGTRLAGLADRFADRTGLGEAMAGTIFLGLVTSLPGLATSVTAALDGRAALAISNALGGIAVQTAFLAVADLSYRKANLEHAVASVQNMMQIVLLVMLLGLVLMAISGPTVDILPVHPVTPLIFVAALVGTFVIYRSGELPMWHPRDTRETVPDVPEEAAKRESLGKLVLKMLVAAVLVLIAGIAVARSTGVIADRTGISESVAGALFSGVVTSLPELVTTLAAIRRGALTLAVGDIVGGNFFDMLFLVAVDIAYLGGSIYHVDAVGQREVFFTGLIILMNMILLAGMFYRQRCGPGNVGLESLLMLAAYGTGIAVLVNMG
ncbi:sodium:calcium antiporter [Proteobacteria bacterium 005FR1]|nr:sodium:calcium antiporter [Proteobacteria bacterium 005FR1]